MNDIVITITPNASLIILVLVIVALVIGWFGGYLKGSADTETRHRGELDRAQAQHAQAVKDLREVALAMDRDQPGSKVPDGQYCPECMSRDGEAHLANCSEDRPTVPIGFRA